MGGISRYDGQKFWSYQNSAFRVTSICEDNKNMLWVGTTAGLARFAFCDSSFQWTKTTHGGLPSDYVVTILKDREGNMWVGTDKGLVVFTSSGRTIVFDGERGLQDDYISGLREDSTGAILIGSGRGIMSCRLRDSGLVDTQELLKGTITGAMIVLRNGNILASSVGDGTVIRYNDGVWQTVFSCKPLSPSLQVRSLGEDEQSNLWIGTNSGLVVVEDKHAAQISRSVGLPNQYIGAIFRDGEGVLWFGTEGGVLKLASTTFRSYNYSTGLPGDHIISIFRDQKKNCWLGTYKGAAMLDPEGQITSFGLSDGLPHLSVHSFAQGANGSIWIGSWDGLVVHENGRLKSGPMRELNHGPVIRLIHDQDGAIWCGMRAKIMRSTREGRVLLTLDAKDGIPDADVSSVFIDKNSIGTINLNLLFAAPSNTQTKTKTGALITISGPTSATQNSTVFYKFVPANAFTRPDGTPFPTIAGGFIQIKANPGEDIIPISFKVVDCLGGQPGQSNTVKIQTWMHTTNTNLPPSFVEKTFSVRCIQ